MAENIIRSPDTLRTNRVPPGQRVINSWPVLHFGRTQEIEIDKWTLRIFGLVDHEKTLKYDEFSSLQKVKVFSDIHCVTTWSKLNNLWEGPSTSILKEVVSINPEARYVVVHAAGGFTTNLNINEFFASDALFAFTLDGKPISTNHGHPVRLIVPSLYFWKSAKWVSGIEFVAKDQPGFWESRGYHNHGDPWKEERYSYL
jgi:DMSO/TMAO reductase YedYZ molybdopterin-dependent catalytic subunit